MAYGNYGNRSYGNNGYQSRSQQTYSKPEKPPFDLNAYIDDMIDVFQLFDGKLKEAGIELPADTVARWVTSAKISMDK